jgi:hypothetical protein
MDEGRIGRDDSGHEILNGLSKQNAIVVALFQSYGEVAEQVDGGNQLHSSVVA